MKVVLKNGQVFIDGKPAKRIHTNGSRQCLVRKGIIVKLNDGLRQSSRELRLWNIIEPKDRKYFVPPISGQIRGKGWIAQRIIKFKRGRRPNWTYYFVENLMRKYGIQDLLGDYFLDGDDEKIISANWGITESGQPIIFDYGW